MKSIIYCLVLLVIIQSVYGLSISAGNTNSKAKRDVNEEWKIYQHYELSLDGFDSDEAVTVKISVGKSSREWESEVGASSINIPLAGIIPGDAIIEATGKNSGKVGSYEGLHVLHPGSDYIEKIKDVWRNNDLRQD
eukprot:TRINITY_DN52211_c0_g1_i1.p1 TRINITY_DN52211_c0_g1~~TRINITY_DN52211_c0_g1_i1.p1  ORF type:complete len:136 (-),score=47.06 TRINITY_DN52211_c0_g1_i1:92-499(-)